MTRDELGKALVMRDLGLSDAQIAQQLMGDYRLAWVLPIVLEPENLAWAMEVMNWEHPRYHPLFYPEYKET
jgi:hypothetical protein